MNKLQHLQYLNFNKASRYADNITAIQAKPSLDLNFARNKSLMDNVTGNNLVTFNRASSGTYVDSAGVLQTAATDVPRFDHNPTTGESLGLLVEEQRSNLCLQSEDFSTTWGTTNYAITTNVATAPNGTITADKAARNTTDATTSVMQNVTVTANTAYNYSIFVKASEWSKVGLREGTVSGNYVTFDLSNGTIISSSVATGTITAFANGWYRISMQMTTGAAQTTYGVRLIPLPNSYISGTPSYSFAGDGTSGLFAWGAQLEAGAFPTSYIPTTTAAVTRSADVASISGSAFSGWYSQSEGTFFAECAVIASTGAPQPILHANAAGSDTPRIMLIRRGDGRIGFNVFSTVTDADIDSGVSLSVSSVVKSAAVYKVNDFALTASGVTPVLDTSGIVPTVDRIGIGFRAGAGTYLNGHIRRLTYFPQRISNANLQRITQ